jgi:dephospho-CoA kinase
LSKRPVFILGLTGSIAMGKTTVSNMFRDLKVPVWCADTEVHKLYSKEGSATKIIKKFYPEVVIKSGVDKTKLKELIHQDNGVLGKIEKIVHPLLKSSKDTFLECNKRESVIIFDIPLLFEKNQQSRFNGVVVVTASAKTQRDRVLKRANMTEKDFEFIKQQQIKEEEKIKKADFIINTDKSLSETKEDVKNLLYKIKIMAL